MLGNFFFLICIIGCHCHLTKYYGIWGAMVLGLLGRQLASRYHLRLKSAVLNLLNEPGLSLNRHLVPASLVPDLWPLINRQPWLMVMSIRICLLSRLKDLSERCLLGVSVHLWLFRLLIRGLCSKILQVDVALVPVRRLCLFRLRLP